MVVKGFAGSERLPWSTIERVRVDTQTRLTSRTELLEIDTGEGIFLLSRFDLGAPCRRSPTNCARSGEASSPFSRRSGSDPAVPRDEPGTGRAEQWAAVYRAQPIRHPPKETCPTRAHVGASTAANTTTPIHRKPKTPTRVVAAQFIPRCTMPGVLQILIQAQVNDAECLIAGGYGLCPRISGTGTGKWSPPRQGTAPGRPVARLRCGHRPGSGSPPRLPGAGRAWRARR